MNQFKVVITDYEFDDLSIEEELLSQLNVDLIKTHSKSEEEFIHLAKDADAIINQYTLINKKVINELHKCKVISRYGVGVDNIDVNAANSKGIYVCNVPDYGIEEVSNHTLALLFTWSRKIVQLNNYVKKGEWDYKLGMPIQRYSNQTIGIFGFGKIPQRLVEKAKVFNFNILVHDPFVSDDIIKKHGAKSVSMECLFKESDYVLVHTPLTEKTKHIIDYEKFKMMKSNSVIINTARGAIINEKDLIKALKKKLIAGAALDVLEKEPINKNHPLLKLNNVILTPHSAWYSHESMIELRSKTTKNVIEVLEGIIPKYAVNKNDIKRII